MEPAPVAKPWTHYRFPLILLGAIALGCGLGAVMGEKAAMFKPLGDLFLNAMFIVVVPLVFFTIANAVLNMGSLHRLGRVMGAMLGVFLVTGLVAALVMLAALSVFAPAAGVEIPASRPETPLNVNAVDQLVQALSAGDFLELLSKRNMLSLILFTLLFAISLHLLGETAAGIKRGISVLAQATIQMVKLIMYYAPIGLGAYFANLVGDFGPHLLGAYLRSMAFFYAVCLAYFLGAFTLYAALATSGRGVGTFWRHIVTPALTALGTGSSTATLPVNLQAAARMGIPRDIREMVLPFGATTHMEGSCLSGILKIAFLFGVFQMPFEGVTTYLSAIVVSVLGGIMLSGVPGGGLVGELLIVNLYGFPPEAFPIIVTLGFLVDPVTTMLNASGDSCSALLVTRLVDGKGWFAAAQAGTSGGEA